MYIRHLYKSIQDFRHARKWIHYRNQQHVNVQELSKDFLNLNFHCWWEYRIVEEQVCVNHGHDQEDQWTL